MQNGVRVTLGRDNRCQRFYLLILLGPWKYNNKFRPDDLRKRILDFSQLDPITAKLDLAVQAPNEVERPILPLLDEITSAIPTSTVQFQIAPIRVVWIVPIRAGYLRT